MLPAPHILGITAARVWVPGRYHTTKPGSTPDEQHDGHGHGHGHDGHGHRHGHGHGHSHTNDVGTLQEKQGSAEEKQGSAEVLALLQLGQIPEASVV